MSSLRRRYVLSGLSPAVGLLTAPPSGTSSRRFSSRPRWP